MNKKVVFEDVDDAMIKRVLSGIVILGVLGFISGGITGAIIGALIGVIIGCIDITDKEMKS